MRRTRTIRALGLLSLLVLLGATFVVATTLSGRSQQNDTGIVAGLLSRALSTPTTRIAIGAVEGALSSDVIIRDVTISDRDGVWISLDRARMVWRRTALLFRRLEIERLEVGNLTVARRPIPSSEAVSDEPILPELPLKLVVENFTLAQLALGEPVLGVEARLAATGSASLGNPSEGLKLQLDARRLDVTGTLAAKLGYVPESGQLDLSLKLDEPANGLLVNAANVPGRPPATLDLSGSGTLDSFAARLAFDAGQGIGANGTAQLQRDGTARRLTLDLASRIEGLLPSLAQPVFSGTTRLDSVVRFADDGAITIQPLTIASNTARMDVRGTLSPDWVADLAVAVRSVPNAGGKTAADGAEIRNLVFDATVAGPLSSPKVAAALSVDDAKLPQGKLGKLTARFDATPNAVAAGQPAVIPFRATADASGIEATDLSLARAIGNTFSLRAEGTFRDGVADVTQSQIRTATANAAFTGRAGGSLLNGRLTLDAPDLTRFGALAGLDLRGALGVTAQLDGVPNTGRIAAALDGRIRNFASGVAAVDGLAGDTVTLAGTVRKLPNGGFGFQNLRLNGAHVTSRVDGDVTLERAALDAAVTVADLSRADRRISGRAEARARITGTLDKPDAAVTAEITNARALGRPVPRLALQAQATDILGALDARATLAGLVDGKEARGALHLRRAQGGWQIDDLDVAVGSVSARGALTLDAASLAQGRLTVAARDLNDLSPLVLTQLAGRLDAGVSLAVVSGGQNATISAQGSNLKVDGAAIDRLDANLTLRDVYRRPVVDGEASIDRAVIGGEAISRVRLVAKGAASASDITLTAEARGFALDAQGRIVPGDNIRFELARFTARRGERRLALANPATVTLVDGGVDIRSLALAIDNGRLTVNGRAGSTYDLAVTTRSVPLAVADIAMPDLGLQGSLNGEARITGTLSALNGNWKVTVAGLSSTQTRSFALPPIDIDASGRLAGRRATLDASLTARGAGNIRIAGTVPFEGNGLDVTAKGRINLGIVNSRITAAGRRVGGNADVDLRVGGNLSQPRVDGGVSLSGGTFSDATYGVQLTAISGRVAARGENLTIERLSARTPNGGTLSLSGQVRIDPQAGFPGTIEISGQRAALVSSDVVKVIASLRLALSGPLARDPRVTGRVDVQSMDVTVPERLPATMRPLPGTRYVSPPPQLRARLAAEAKARARDVQSPPFDAALDVEISAPNRVFVRGRGIDAELGGSVRLTGRLSAPVTVGAFDLRRGRLQIVGTRLDFSRGRLAFTGDIVPELDLMAETRAGDITAQVTVSGRATEPTFEFSSSPDLPQDEILSRLLFQKASGGLSPFQALQLAQTVAQLTGGGTDTFERLRKSLGVDTLDISTGPSGDPTVGVSRAISNRVSVGIKGGATGESTGVTVDIDVTKRVRVQGEAYGNGGTAIGIGAEWEY